MVKVILDSSSLLTREINLDDCTIEPFGLSIYRVIDPGCGAVIAISPEFPPLAKWLYKQIHS